MNRTRDPTSNLLLAALPGDILARWQDQLESVELHRGQVLYEAGCAPTDVYFPSTAIVSLLYGTAGDSTEIAAVGNEGVVGIAVFMGGETVPNRALVQSGGAGYRLKAETVKAEFELSGPVTHLLLRYTQALITQVAQTAVCNRHHSIDQQLSRWLLTSLDRIGGNELAVTHESIGGLLGVRREGVTEAALKLQRAGLIRYARGHITVLDRPGVERRACECYAVVRSEYKRLLPKRVAT
ncbi:MAG TPA: Crp/Fnr family transcriptional regulator [Burkholderiaceae bacterium]|nr:Crp/Fnr family transcriptional regulator [Burkholderiaceae bacterium]